MIGLFNAGHLRSAEPVLAAFECALICETSVLISCWSSGLALSLTLQKITHSGQFLPHNEQTDIGRFALSRDFQGLFRHLGIKWSYVSLCKRSDATI